MKREHLTLSAILAGLAAVGGLVAYSVDWGIKTQDRLGDSQAQRDSLVTAIQVLDRRVYTLEKKAKVKGGRVVVMEHPKHEGIVTKLFHLFI